MLFLVVFLAFLGNFLSTFLGGFFNLLSSFRGGFLKCLLDKGFGSDLLWGDLGNLFDSFSNLFNGSFSFLSGFFGFLNSWFLGGLFDCFLSLGDDLFDYFLCFSN